MLVGQCKLCLQTKGLQDSHYIPKSAYKSNRAPKLKNPNPVGGCPAFRWRLSGGSQTRFA